VRVRDLNDGHLRWWALVLAVLLSQPGTAHPMPNTEILVSVDGRGATFEIAVPAPELRLALPREWSRDADLLAEPRRSMLLRYFSDHFALRSDDGRVAAHRIESITRWRASDPDVGEYEEILLRIVVPAGDGFDPRAFALHYDAVIHQVPNHFALVRVDRRAGAVGDGGPQVDLHAIRYDFARDITPGLRVAIAPAGKADVIRDLVALGFRHVISGVDHLLFLITLLVVAPLRQLGGRWSLFQGWRYTTRRFFAISIAFTAGHTVALFLGTYQLISIPQAAVEVAIGGSVLVAAVHGLRPLYPGREWMIAGGFGLVHGLAFSQSLAELLLPDGTRALAVMAFNIGVEGAQLVAMAIATPLLVASRFQWFRALRVSSMMVTAAVAVVWIAARLGLGGAVPQ
jgi:hypothetical protein